MIASMMQASNVLWKDHVCHRFCDPRLHQAGKWRFASVSLSLPCLFIQYLRYWENDSPSFCIEEIWTVKVHTIFDALLLGSVMSCSQVQIPFVTVALYWHF